VFENEVLRRICGPDKEEVSNLGYYVTRNFMVYTGYLVLL